MELEAIGCYDLRLSRESFWDLHPCQFEALYLRYLQSLLPLAILTAIYVNAHKEEGADKASPLDFIPGLQSGPQEMTPEVRSTYDQLAIDQTMDRLRSIEKYEKSKE